MGDVIDLAAAREKRDRAARDEAVRVIGAALFIGAMVWMIARALSSPGIPAKPDQ